MKRKIIVFFLSVAMIISLAACGQSQQQSTTNDETANNTTAAATQADDKSSAAGNTEIVVTINVGDNPATEASEGTADELLKLREEAVKKGDNKELSGAGNVFTYNFTKVLRDKLAADGITIRYVDWGWDVPLTQKETAAIMAGEGPDVFTGELQMQGLIQQGALEPFPEELAAKIRQTIVPGAYSAMVKDGVMYGCVAKTSVCNLYWNKAILRKVGLDPEKAPTTWDELLANMKKVREYNNGEFYGGGFFAGSTSGGWLRLGPFMVINKGWFVDDNNVPAFNSKENIETFEFMRTMDRYNEKGVMSNSVEDNFTSQFLQGKSAYFIDGSWRYVLAKEAGVDVGIAALPLSKNGAPGNVTIAAGFYSVPKYSKNKEAAFKYIEAMVSKEAQQELADAGSMPPVYMEIAESDAYKTKFPNLYMVYQELKGNVKGLPTFTKENTKTWEAFNKAMTKTLMTDESIEKILNEAQEEAMKLQK